MIKFYQKLVAPRVDHKPDTANATRVRGFVPVTADWINETTSEGTFTVSLSSVIATNAVAVAVVVRLQDNAANSFAEVRAKTSVSTNSAAKLRVVCNNTSSTGPQTLHGVIPVNTTRQVRWQIYDAKSTAVQTASLGLLGYYY